MADVFKPTFHCDIPPTAKIIERDGRKIARFKNSVGNFVEGEIFQNDAGENRCRVPTDKYYARVKHPDGRTRRVPLGVTDKEAARQLRIKLQKAADQMKAGIIDPFAGHQRRPLIGSAKPLPKRSHQRDSHGRIVKFASQLAREDLERAIAGSHLSDYRSHLQGAGRSVTHIWEILRIIRRVSIACNFHCLGDMEANVFDKYLAALIAEGKSFRTRNAALKSVRAFVRWLVKSDRILKDPFRMLSAVNEQSDPNRRQRRPLEPSEFTRLIAAAENGKMIESISGSERAILYLIAAWTGLRRKELAAITPANLSLDREPPCIHIRAASTKAKRDDQPIPLHPMVAQKLREWLVIRNADPSERIFHLMTRSGRLRKTSKMMEIDCTAADLPYVGDLGVADFHSHRMAFITNLCRTADFSTVVDLARHSDPKLTSKIYDRVRLENRVAAINSLMPPGTVG